MPKRVLMHVSRDVREPGAESVHYDAGEVAVFSDRTTQILVRANECKVLSNVPADYNPTRTTREESSGRLAAKQASHADKSATSPQTKAEPRKSTKKKPRGGR